MSKRAFTEKQRLVWRKTIREDHRWNISYGATRSGKTYLDYYKIPRRIIDADGGGLIVLLGNTQATLERNILEPMRGIWGAELVGQVNSKNEVYLFGRKAYAIGADKESQVKRIQGAGFSYVYGDEVATWAPGVFDMLKSRLDKPNSKFDGTCNPDAPTHWFKKFIDRTDLDIFSQGFTIDDNPKLPRAFVEQLKKEYRGTVLYNRYILGEWARAEGLVYQVFKEAEHVLKYSLKLAAECTANYISCDYGIMNPTVYHYWGYHPAYKWIALREYYYSGKGGTPKTDNQLADDLEEFSPDCRRIVVDPSASSFIAELEQRGWEVLKGNNNVKEGIGEVGKHLNRGELHITTRCEKTIDEFHSYSYDDKKGDDSVVEEDDHTMDSIRYFINTVGKYGDADQANYTGRGAMRT